MARGVMWWVRAAFDRAAAKKTEEQLAESLTSAGKEGGKGFSKSFLSELRKSFDKRMADLRVQVARGAIDPAEFKKQANLAAKEFNAGLLAGMDKARAAGKLTDSEYLKLSRTFKKVGEDGQKSAGAVTTAFTRLGAQIALLFGARQIIQFFQESVTAAFDAEKSTNTFREALGKLGIAYADVADDAEKHFSQLQNTTRFTDDDARDALANLVTITGDYEKSLSLLNLTADVAARRNTTMATAAETVAKASLGLSKGMQDLGIKAGDTGDIVEKLRRNLGGLAASEGQELGTRVTILNHLWEEFKEKVGLAIIGSDRLGGSVGGLQRALIGLNDWMDTNGESLGKYLDKLIAAAAAVAKLGLFIVEHTPNLYTASKAWDWLRGRVSAAGDAVATTAPIVVDGMQKIVAQRRLLTADEQTALGKLLEDGGAERAQITQAEVNTLLRIRRDAKAGLLTLTKEQEQAVTSFLEDRAKASERVAQQQAERFRERKAAIEQELQDLARLRAAQGTGREGQVATDLQREADLRKQLEGLTASQRDAITQLVTARNAERDAIDAQAQAERDRAAENATYDALEWADRQEAFRKEQAAAEARKQLEAVRQGVAAGAITVQTETNAALHNYNREQFIANALLQAGAVNGTAFAATMRSIAEAQYDAANKFVSPWEEAFGSIEQQAEEMAGVFGAVGKAWAQDGIAGIATLAKTKVKENVAYAIEEAAKALGSLAIGNVAGAKEHSAAAIKHTLAAARWGAVAAGGGGAATAGSGGAIANPSAGSNTQPRGPEVTIVLSGPGWDALNPRVQEVIHGAQQEARTRYGENARIRVTGRGQS